MDIYQELLEGLNNLSANDEVSGLDTFLSQDKVKLSSFDQLLAFTRIGDETLVHKAEKDLWRITEGNNGEPVIERLFDPNTNQPLKV
jgi:hypothetical protein